MEIKKVKILIVDDHQMIRDGIKIMLESQHKTHKFFISEAKSGEAAIDKVLNNNFDIILMDYQLPNLNGADTVNKIIMYKPNSKVLALSNYDEYAYITNIMGAGAKGYILKNIGPNELIQAIDTILLGKKYYANDIALKIIDEDATAPKKNNGLNITARELEVLKMIVGEMTNEEIAKKLSIAKRTVDSHRQNMINKFQIKNTVGLVKFALENKLI